MSKLFHITCTLPNASLSINGIDFVQVEKELIITANPVAQHIADHFGVIPGYDVTEFSEEDAEALEAARKLEEQARARAANQAKRAAAARKAAPAPAPPEVSPETPADADADATKADGEPTDAETGGQDEAKGGDPELF